MRTTPSPCAAATQSAGRTPVPRATRHGPTPSRRRPRSPRSRRATASSRWPGHRPPNKGSDVLEYRVQWTNIGGGAGAGGIQAVPAPTTTKVITGLVNNDAYTVRVQAKNEAGWGPFGPEVKAQSFGKPAAVPAPTLNPREPVPGEPNAQVAISWPATDPNGPPITQYDVYRRSGGGAWTLHRHRLGGSVPRQQRHRALPGPAARVRRDRHQRWSSHERPGQLQLLRRRRRTGDALRWGPSTTPNPDYRANASFSLGDSRSTRLRQGQLAHECRSLRLVGLLGGLLRRHGRRPRQHPAVDGDPGVQRRRAVLAAGPTTSASIPTARRSRSPTPTRDQRLDGNFITFSWDAARPTAAPITGYEVAGDRKRDLGADARSIDLRRLGCDTSARSRCARDRPRARGPVDHHHPRGPPNQAQPEDDLLRPGHTSARTTASSSPRAAATSVAPGATTCATRCRTTRVRSAAPSTAPTPTDGLGRRRRDGRDASSRATAPTTRTSSTGSPAGR